MMQEKKRLYQIPRKVNAGFRVVGLSAFGLLVMVIPVGIAALIWLTPLERFGKLVISVLLVYGSYLMLTVDLNGLTGFRFVWMLIKHMDDQKVYNLTTSNDFSPEEKTLIRRYKEIVEDNADGNS
jgi:hypothetical protein